MILGNALDTNGQNARYAEAARKHGTDERVLKALAIGHYDPAGVAERFRLASEKHGGLEIRAAHRTIAYFDFPTDLRWGREATRRQNDEVFRLAHEADVIHLNNDTIAMQKLRLRKPALLHHHGTLFRNDPNRLLVRARQARMAQAVSTVDLMRPAPELLHWLPTAYDVAALRKMRRKRKDDGRVRIVHAPTNRAGKHTALFLEACQELILEGLPIDVILVEGVTNAECLAIKATADMVYDQLAWGYGCNSVEAWGMRIPVISGSDDWTRRQMGRMWGTTPYYDATEKTLKQKIRAMASSADLRAEYAERGHQHVLTHHDELPALERLVELYHVAMRSYQSRRIPQKGARPVTFANRSGRTVRIEGEPVIWGPDGTLTTDDPMVVTRLQYFARTRPLFGIEEVA